jgi:hypothetical protein
MASAHTATPPRPPASYTHHPSPSATVPLGAGLGGEDGIEDGHVEAACTGVCHRRMRRPRLPPTQPASVLLFLPLHPQDLQHPIDLRHHLRRRAMAADPEMPLRLVLLLSLLVARARALRGDV